jgi:uncharacterized protein YbjT (DUF2867 family)
MLVIAGITGHIGAELARILLAEGRQVRALVRDPARIAPQPGLELFAADLTDEAALRRAFAGAEAAWLLAPPAPQHPDLVGQAIAIATAVRAAARAAGLRRLVFLSSEAAHLPEGNGPIRQLHVAEAMLADAAPEVSFLRASYFAENWAGVFAAAREQGVLPTFLADPAAKRSMIATRDIARTAAGLLTEAGRPPRVVELSSATLFSAEDAAAAAAAVLGRPVRVVQPPRDAWQGILEGAGLGAAYAALLVEMNDGINSGLVRFEGKGRQVTGPTTLEQVFRGWV